MQSDKERNYHVCYRINKGARDSCGHLNINPSDVKAYRVRVHDMFARHVDLMLCLVCST
jgi:hypothetical protein